MYVGEKGILLAGFNGNNPRVYPESPKYAAPARQESQQVASSSRLLQTFPDPIKG